MLLLLLVHVCTDILRIPFKYFLIQLCPFVLPSCLKLLCAEFIMGSTGREAKYGAHFLNISDDFE